MVVIEFGITISFRLVQPLKAWEEIVVTELGISIDVSSLHLPKAYVPIDVSELERVTDDNLEHW